MSSSPLVSVVVPNWNGRDLIDRCLDSVRAQTVRDLEIIVVDNGSTDGSPEHLRRQHPDVRLVALAVNRGFAGGVNAGVRAARGEFVALLNNDAWAAPDWLERLTARLASEPTAGACAPKIYRAEGCEPTGRLDSTGELYSIWGLPFPRGRDELDRGQYDDAKAVFAVSGPRASIAPRSSPPWASSTTTSSPTSRTSTCRSGRSWPASPCSTSRAPSCTTAWARAPGAG